MKYLFLLGREPLLSERELASLFDTISVSWSWAIIETVSEYLKQVTSCLGGTIKIAEIIEEHTNTNDLKKVLTKIYEQYSEEGKKLRIALDNHTTLGKNLIFQVKDELKRHDISVRVVQHDGSRVKTATTIHEKLIERWCELVLMNFDGKIIIGKTVWIQDIEGYTHRDIGRERSMRVGMMPPKLVQMMINLATRWERDLTIYDPFCGLGTTLIEGANADFWNLIGSDISEDMAEATTHNMSQYTGMVTEIFQEDARSIASVELQEKTVIVTEGMLGHNFAPWTITHERVMQERKFLTKLYQDFLEWAYRNNAITTICCTLPVWNIGREKVYMPDLRDLAPDWRVDPICQAKKRYLEHSRPGQSVSREIILLTKSPV